MKSLVLVRHAKSSWKESGSPDQERKLSSRGKRDAPFMASLLKSKGFKPDLVISSPAERCRQTAQFFSAELGIDQNSVVYDENLYLAGDDEILAVINKIDSSVKNLLVIGHNPGLTDLANMLSGYFIDNIPTAGIAAFNFDEEKWSRLRSQCCSFSFFEYPKKHFSAEQ